MKTHTELVSLLRGLSPSPLSSGPEEFNDPLLSTAEAAAYLGLADNTMSVWRCTGRYDIPFIKVGRLVKYRRSELDAFLERRTQGQIERPGINSDIQSGGAL